MLDITDENIRYKRIAVAAFAAQRRVLRKLPADINPSPQQVANVCLRVFRLLQQGRCDEAHAMAREALEMAICAIGAAVDVGKLGQRLQDSLDAATALEFTALERSVVPEVQKTQKRKRIIARMEKYPRAHWRKALDGVYDQSVIGLTTAEIVGNEVAREWTSVFQERFTIEADMDWSLLCSPSCGTHDLDMAGRSESSGREANAHQESRSGRASVQVMRRGAWLCCEPLGLTCSRCILWGLFS